ncbi:MAG: hypothetical protein Q7R35_14515 [Elusimicrobiota bacterium]|nr:hypothetical protein [Elusimicrobiota bacterium]
MVDPQKEYQRQKSRCICRLERAGERIRKAFPRFRLDTIPFDDQAVIGEVVRHPHPLMRSCYRERRQKAFLWRLNPQSVSELAAALAIFRPGAVFNEVTDAYIGAPSCASRKNKIRGILAAVTVSTRGIIIYQEQILEAAKLAGLSTREAEFLRRYAGRNMQIMEQNKPGFVAVAVRNGNRRKDAETLYDELCKAGCYAFNRGHAMETVLLVYRMAYLARYFPREYGRGSAADRYIPRPDKVYEVRQ